MSVYVVVFSLAIALSFLRNSLVASFCFSVDGVEVGRKIDGFFFCRVSYYTPLVGFESTVEIHERGFVFRARIPLSRQTIPFAKISGFRVRGGMFRDEIELDIVGRKRPVSIEYPSPIFLRTFEAAYSTSRTSC
jgi:hypothetical protein